LGKLADLRAKREEMDWDHPDRIKLEKEINRIEQWMIDNNIGSLKKVTTWTKGQGKSNGLFGFNREEEYENTRYPWHVACIWVDDLWMLKSHNGKQNLNRDGSPHQCEFCS